MENSIYLAPDACWHTAPRERTRLYFHTYSRVSMALQRTLRQLVPKLFFADVNHFEDPLVACPMLIYAASPLFRPSVRTEFNWDVLHTSSMQSFFRQAQRSLPAQLDSVQSRLSGAGRVDLLTEYRPDHAPEIIEMVKTYSGARKLLQRAVVGEGRLVNELTAFSTLALASPRVREKKIADVAKNWHLILSRFYGAQDFTALEPVLLDVATRAFLEARMVHQTEPGAPEQLAA